MAKTNQKTRTVGNGEGSLYYSKALKKWVYQYYIDGDPVRKTMTQKKNENIREFKARVTDLKNKINNGTFIKKSSETFIDILTKYVNQKHDDGITSERTYCRDLATISQIICTCKNFINKPIQKIRVEDIEESKKNIREYSNNTINKIWRFINKTFEIATARKKIPFNIMLDETLTKPISKKITTQIKALTIEEEKKLIDILNNEEKQHKYRNIILLQLYTGMRIGEVLALSKDCIDLNKNTLTVYRTLTQDANYNIIMGEHTKTFKKTTGIDKGKRTFPINIKVKQLLKEILKDKIQNIDGLLFYDYKNNTYINSKAINSYLERINKKYFITSSSLHTHRLRHTFVTRCVENGIAHKVIQTLVGHAQGSSITEDVYTTISDEFIKNEMKKIK